MCSHCGTPDVTAPNPALLSQTLRETVVGLKAKWGREVSSRKDRTLLRRAPRPLTWNLWHRRANSRSIYQSGSVAHSQTNQLWPWYWEVPIAQRGFIELHGRDHADEGCPLYICWFGKVYSTANNTLRFSRNYGSRQADLHNWGHISYEYSVCFL